VYSTAILYLSSLCTFCCNTCVYLNYCYSASNGPHIIMQVSVGFLGPFGTYTHQAAYERFQKSGVYCEKTTITDALVSLDSLDYVVVPRENSTFGSVTETFDGLRYLKEGFIQGEVVMRIEHCLVVKKGAKLSDIDCVLSHEQALGQCQKFISTHLTSATTSKTTSTAAAADAVSKSEGLNIAAICSKICVTMFENLEILEEGIQDEDNNFTRFFILGRDAKMKPPSYSLYPSHAFIRITSKSSDVTFDLTDLLSILRLSVIRIDRRPHIVSVPFHNIYFLELKSSSHDHSWTDKVEQSVSRLREKGYLVENIGVW